MTKKIALVAGAGGGLGHATVEMDVTSCETRTDCLIPVAILEPSG